MSGKLRILGDSEILCNYDKMSYTRYNHRDKLKNENIAEHAYFISLFCMKVFDQVTLSDDEKLALVVLSIVHGTGEMETSDIPEELKEKNPLLKSILNNAETDYFNTVFKGFRYCLDILQRPNENEKLFNLFKLIDAYSAIQWAINEKILGNQDEKVKGVLEDGRDRVKKYTNRVNALIEIEKEIADKWERRKKELDEQAAISDVVVEMGAGEDESGK